MMHLKNTGNYGGSKGNSNYQKENKNSAGKETVSNLETEQKVGILFLRIQLRPSSKLKD